MRPPLTNRTESLRTCRQCCGATPSTSARVRVGSQRPGPRRAFLPQICPGVGSITAHRTTAAAQPSCNSRAAAALSESPRL